MENLLRFLERLSPGWISNKAKLESLLDEAWDCFDISNDEGMTGEKLLGRMEEVIWDPPILSFTIERHGGTVLGSSRAELHKWEFNISSRKATCKKGRYRQIKRQQPPFKVEGLVKEISELIINRKEDPRLKWYDDVRVRVKISKIIPDSSTPQQTVSGRRKRFRNALDEILKNNGWSKIRENVYSPQ